MERRLLTSEQLGRFREDGFVALPRLVSEEEIGRLREIFHRLFSRGTGWKQGAQFDLAGTDAGGPARLPQILNPAQFAPELSVASFRADALEIARELLGPEATPWFEHAISKPPELGAPTPWHQDEAHRDDIGVAYDQISVWIPLQEATVANGCMRYIAGSHRGPVLPHRSPNNDPRVMALECEGGFEADSAIPCPLPPGGAVIHHCRTLHSAGPNQSLLPRTAYVLAFRGSERPDPSFTGYSWNREKQTAARARSVAWENRGGLLGRAVRSVGRTLRESGTRFQRKLRHVFGAS